MKVKYDKIDLAKSFDRLKDALQRADQCLINPEYENICQGYPAAYGLLSQHVQTFLFLNTEGESMNEIKGINNRDDLTGVFEGPGTDLDIEKELNKINYHE
jgi:hypothetical protein